MKKIAINGYGRIGRGFVRAYFARFDEVKNKFCISNINELAEAENLVYLTKYDSLYGKFNKAVSFTHNQLIIDDCKIALQNHQQVADLDWQNVDILLETSGSFSDMQTAQQHLQRGAKKLLFGNPATKEVDATLIYGVNHKRLDASAKIISAGSCTTNALVPILQVLHSSYTLQSVSATTLHAQMANQKPLDAFAGNDFIASRAGSSILPIATGLANGVVRIMPELKNKIIAHHIRVPAVGVSGMEITVTLENLPATADEVKELFRKKATGVYSKILGVTDEKLASVDLLQDSHSAIVDLNSISLTQNQLRLFAWFDSEWGFANRLIDLILAL